MPLGAGLAWTNDPLPCWMVMARPSCAASSIEAEPHASSWGTPYRGQLGGRGEDPQLAGFRVVDIDGFGEAELGGE